MGKGEGYNEWERVVTMTGKGGLSVLVKGLVVVTMHGMGGGNHVWKKVNVTICGRCWSYHISSKGWRKQCVGRSWSYQVCEGGWGGNHVWEGITTCGKG